MDNQTTQQDSTFSKKIMVYILTSLFFFVSDILSFFWGFKLSPETTETIKTLAITYMGAHTITDVSSIIKGK